MYLVISLLVFRAGYGIWLYQFLIIAYLFTLLLQYINSQTRLSMVCYWSPTSICTSICTCISVHPSYQIHYMQAIRVIHISWADTHQNQQNDMCAQQRLRLAWASPSLIRVFTVCSVVKGPMFLHSDGEDSDQTGRMPGWSKSSLGTQVILLVLSCGGSVRFFRSCTPVLERLLMTLTFTVAGMTLPQPYIVKSKGCPNF